MGAGIILLIIAIIMFEGEDDGRYKNNPTKFMDDLAPYDGKRGRRR
jgi:hypothetical protein